VSALRRGDVVRAEDEPGAVLWVVVSNDLRNATLSTVLAARIMPVVKSASPTAVELRGDDPYNGYVLCDYLSTINASKLSPAGRLSPATIEAVSRALRASMP
jgi:mRNA interferase MazF